ncbi:NGG1p interacting factor NIF3 [Leucothrix sargassi]|nr:NGG1p interacting factor NIF3 [Leucothrix sargassi]
MLSQYVKLAVFVPEENTEAVRLAICEAGAGRREDSNYSHCTFTTKGEGRFRPEEGADPHIGKIGVLEVVPETRIETICLRALLPEVLEAMRKAHPYEEVAFDVWALEDW